MKVLKTGYVLKALLDDGWYIAAIKGSHRQPTPPRQTGKGYSQRKTLFGYMGS